MATAGTAALFQAPMPSPRLSPPLPEPVVFGPVDRALAGWFHAPAGAPRRMGVVLCPPFGYEVMCTHRTYRKLAATLAEAGFPVLRFDMDGSGDSDGQADEGGRVEAWLASIDRAVSALEERAGCTEVCLFGLRLGALLAAVVSERRPDVTALALWATPSSGKAFVREARAFSRLQQVASSRQPVPGLELAGYHLAPETIEHLSRLTLPTAAPAGARRALLLGRDDVEGSETEVSAALGRWGVEVESPQVPGYAGMMRDPEFSQPPALAMEAIRDWLDRIAGPAKPEGRLREPTPGPRKISMHAPGGELVTEEAVRFGPAGNLFGIVAEPASGGKPRRQAVLFLSVGSNHHVGSHRLYVTLSRQLAARGYAALRFDIAGVGDSPPRPAAAENALYTLDSVSDVQAAMDFLQQRLGIERFVVAGICSGAFLAFHSASKDPRIVGQILVNPQLFVWTASDTLDIKKRFLSTRFYRRKLLDPDVLRRLVRGEVKAAAIMHELSLRTWKRMFAMLPVPERLLSENERAHRRVRHAFHRITERGLHSLLVYASDDAGVDTIERYLGTEARALAGRPNFRMIVLDEVDHTFTPQWSQAWLSDLFLDHVLARFP